MIKNLIWSLFVRIDSRLKFPNLKPGDIGIQLGFDMASPKTTDLFLMHRRVRPAGFVLGIDPDSQNIEAAQMIIDEKQLNIQLIHRAVFSEKGYVDLLQGELPGWNQLNNIPVDSTVKYSGKKVTVPMDTLDNILAEYEIDIFKVGHINITINGSEYYALLGMENILKNAQNINLTIIAGRYDESGVIENLPDYEMIIPQLTKFGFECKFRRIHQLLWWGFFTKLLLNRQWVFGRKNYGVIMAAKGSRKLKWFQSFS